MLASFLHSGFYYLVLGLVVGLLVFFVYRGTWKRLTGVSVYLFALLLIDGVARRYVLYHYGVKSLEYFYSYWLTDVALTLGAFLLVCTFFRRACANNPEMWRHVRLLLIFVFLLVVGISAFSLSKSYADLFSILMIEFQQNLYFTCLVLNTLLYVMMKQMESGDDELDLLVCGLGLQFAGPAASFALKFLTPGIKFTESLLDFVMPVCTLGMLITWFYAVVRVPKTATASSSRELVQAMAAGQDAA